MVAVRHEEHSAIDYMNRMVTLIAAVDRVTETMVRARVDRRNRAWKVNIKLRNLFRHQIDNDDMPRIGITDQESTCQLRTFAFFMLHVLVFVVRILILVVGVFVFIICVFVFTVTMSVNLEIERDWVYVFRNLKHRIVIRRGILDQLLQPQILKLQPNRKHEISVGHASDIASARLISVRIGSARHQI